jgi:phage shock protein C
VNRRLYRSSSERILGGVAGGVADYFDLDPALVRIAWAILILASGGIFLLLYLVMWFVVPESPSGFAYSQWPSAPPPGGEPMSSTESTEGSAGTAAAGADTTGTPSANPTPPPPPSIAHEWAGRRAERRRHRSGGGGIVIGALLILLGVWFLAQDWIPWLRRAELWPIALVLLGVVLLVGAMGRRTD